MSQYLVNTVMVLDQNEVHIWQWKKCLYYLNEGYEWIVDLDIEKFFDTVNHDKLISILRERVNDAATLHLNTSISKSRCTR